jgi:hypothetical protein
MCSKMKGLRKWTDLGQTSWRFRIFTCDERDSHPHHCLTFCTCLSTGSTRTAATMIPANSISGPFQLPDSFPRQLPILHFDCTSVYPASNPGDASSHSTKNLPDVPRRPWRQARPSPAFRSPPVCNLCVSLLRPLGIETDHFGTSHGTLPGLSMAYSAYPGEAIVLTERL